MEKEMKKYRQIANMPGNLRYGVFRDSIIEYGTSVDNGFNLKLNAVCLKDKNNAKAKDICLTYDGDNEQGIHIVTENKKHIDFFKLTDIEKADILYDIMANN